MPLALHPDLRASPVARRSWLCAAYAALTCVSLGASRAHAAEATPLCLAPTIVAADDLPEVWRSALRRSCTTLTTAVDVDRTAVVRVRLASDGADVDVTLSDGRVAHRFVGRAEEIELTIDALIRIPSPPAAVAPVAPTDVGSTAALPPTRAATTPVTPTAEEPLPLEGGAELIGRIAGGDGYVSAGAIAWIALVRARWLVGLSVRWDPWESLISDGPDHFEMSTAGGGFFGAWRAHVSDLAMLDVGGQMQIVNEAQRFKTGDADADDKHSSETTIVEFGALARLHVVSPTTRLTISLNADLMPTRMRQTVRLGDGFPSLPAWALGLGVGMSWGKS